MLCITLYILSVTEKVCRTCSALSIAKIARQRVCRTGSAMPTAKVYIYSVAFNGREKVCRTCSAMYEAKISRQRVCRTCSALQYIYSVAFCYGKSLQNILCTFNNLNSKTESVQDRLCHANNKSLYILSGFYGRNVQKILCIVRNKKYQDKECAEQFLYHILSDLYEIECAEHALHIS